MYAHSVIYELLVTLIQCSKMHGWKSNPEIPPNANCTLHGQSKQCTRGPEIFCEQEIYFRGQRAIKFYKINNELLLYVCTDPWHFCEN